MSRVSSIAQLFKKYAALAEKGKGRRDADLERSLEYFRAELRRPKDALSSKNRIVRWVCNVQLVDTFAQEAGRLPRENNRRLKSATDPHEQRLAEWLRYQRRPIVQAQLCQYQRDRLECLPGFSWNPLDGLWDDQLVKYTQFLKEFHRVPRFRTEEREERALAAWASKQRYYLRRGTLPDHRAHQFKEAMKAWGK